MLRTDLSVTISNSQKTKNLKLELLDYSDASEFAQAIGNIFPIGDLEGLTYVYSSYIPPVLFNSSGFPLDMLFELLKEMNDRSIDEYAFDTYIYNIYSIDCLANDGIAVLLAFFEESYQGSFESEEDFALYYVHEYSSISPEIEYYFDYELYASDLFLYNFTFIDGFVFINK